MMYFNSVFLLGVLSLSSACLETKEEKCTPILQEILDTQAKREIIRKDFHITHSDFEKGYVSPRMWNETRRLWLKRENSLASSANALYDRAYRLDCFN